MKLKSVSGLSFYVKDLGITHDFYEALGFVILKRSDDVLSVRLNWFVMQFMPITNAIDVFKAEAQADPKGSGIYVNVTVEDVDEAYAFVTSKGMKPSSEPKDWPWGNREFVLRDPDGYKLVFMAKTKK